MPENLHFRSYDPDQTLLFPQRIDRDIPKDDPVRITKKLDKTRQRKDNSYNIKVL